MAAGNAENGGGFNLANALKGAQELGAAAKVGAAATSLASNPTQALSDPADTAKKATFIAANLDNKHVQDGALAAIQGAAGKIDPKLAELLKNPAVVAAAKTAMDTIASGTKAMQSQTPQQVTAGLAGAQKAADAAQGAGQVR